jgi:hypothetical protein
LGFSSYFFVFAHESLDSVQALDRGQFGAGEFLFEAAHPVFDGMIDTRDDFFRDEGDEIGA